MQRHIYVPQMKSPCYPVFINRFNVHLSSIIITNQFSCSSIIIIKQHLAVRSNKFFKSPVSSNQDISDHTRYENHSTSLEMVVIRVTIPKWHNMAVWFVGWIILSTWIWMQQGNGELESTVSWWPGHTSMVGHVILSISEHIVYIYAYLCIFHHHHHGSKQGLLRPCGPCVWDMLSFEVNWVCLKFSIPGCHQNLTDSS